MTQGNQEPSGWDAPRNGHQPYSDHPQPPAAEPMNPTYGYRPYGQEPFRQVPYGQGPYGAYDYGQAYFPPGPDYPVPPAPQEGYGQPGYYQQGYAQPYGPPGYPTGYVRPEQDTVYMAARRTPLVLSILSTVFGALGWIIPFFFAIAGLILGVIALPQVLNLRKRFPYYTSGGMFAMSIVGISLSVLGLLGFLTFLGLGSSL